MEGPRSAVTAPPPGVRTAENGGEPARVRWPTCRAEIGSARGGERASERAPGEEAHPTPPLLRLAPRCWDLDQEGSPPQEKVPDSGRVSVVPGGPAALRPSQREFGSSPGRGEAWGVG